MIYVRNNRKRRKQIKKFFNESSVDRDAHLASCPIINYEQEMRQKSVIELLSPSENNLILDIGCGNARDIELFSMMGALCVGIDLSKGMIKEAREKVKGKNIDSEFIIGDATNLPFVNNSLNKISCSETIEHIPKWEKAINEMQRVLTQDGLLAITTPNMKSLYGLTKIVFDLIGKIFRIRNKHPYDDWKTQKEVLNIMRKNGFIIKEKLGICFIPGHWTYFLPNFLKNRLVKIINSLENEIRSKLTSYGYMIGLSVVKRDFIRRLV